MKEPIKPASVQPRDVAYTVQEREQAKAERKAGAAKLRRDLVRMLGPLALDLVHGRTVDREKEPGRLTLAVDEPDGDGYAVAFLEDGAFLTISILRDTGKRASISFRTDGEAGRVLREVAARVQGKA